MFHAERVVNTIKLCEHYVIPGWWVCPVFHAEKVADTIKLCERYHGSWVVGVDMAGDESLPLDPLHVEGFQKAKALGLHVTQTFTSLPKTRASILR